MGKRIAVAGAGHGGLVAAYYLACAGYDVTVYEKKAKGTLGYEQSDSVHIDGFEEAGIPVPEAYRVKRTPLSFLVPELGLPPVTQGVSEDSYNVEIDRKALYAILIGMAEDAGAKMEYETEIEAPILLGSRVCGVKTNRGDIYADLVIDAAGLHSPLRTGLPEYFGIEKEAGDWNVLYAYRGYFERKPDMEAPALKYQVYLEPGEEAGLMWVITHETETDILIGKFRPLSEEMIGRKLGELREMNPHIGQKLLRGGKTAEIPLRQPLGMLVADGYAAVGDSAFMTIPLKGSGVGYSMRAGRLLAAAVEADENGCFTRETLWSYQHAFFENIGFDAGLLAFIKDLIPQITAEDIEYLMNEGIFSPETLQKFGNEEGLVKIVTSMGFSGLRDTAKKIVGHPNVRRMLINTGKNVAKYTLLKQNLKAKYEPKAAEKWIRAYRKFYDNVYKTED